MAGSTFDSDSPYFTAAHGFGGVYSGRSRSAGGTTNLFRSQPVGATASGVLGAGGGGPNMNWGAGLHKAMTVMGGQGQKAGAFIQSKARSRMGAFSGMHSTPAMGGPIQPGQTAARLGDRQLGSIGAGMATFGQPAAAGLPAMPAAPVSSSVMAARRRTKMDLFQQHIGGMLNPR